LFLNNEPDSLTAAAELFRNIGYDVELASDAVAAINVLKNRPGIGTVFSDVMMPGGESGIELSRRIHELYPAIRIVLASGFPLTVLRRQHGDLSESLNLTGSRKSRGLCAREDHRARFGASFWVEGKSVAGIQELDASP
jgi:CheY-like chemotaxis protein